jgi:hypothetical protein
MFSIFQPDLINTTPQVFPLVGGQSGSVNVYLQFTVAPSAGTVSVEYRRPSSTAWSFLQGGQNVPVTSGSVSLRIDGGISALRITFTGLTGGAGALLATSDVNTATPPKDLLTDGGFGASRRLRVDPGQTGFFAGRMFRSYIEQVIPAAGPSVQFRFTSPIDFILWTQRLDLTQGALRFEVFTGATSSGVWTPLPVIGVNRMAERPTPLYAPQVVVETGGNFTGGTAVDLMLIRSGSNQGSNSSQNTGGETSERGLPAGVYHGRFSTLTGGVTVTDAAQMVYSLQWEERPVIT